MQPRVRKQQVEEHHDDCGSSLISLSKYRDSSPSPDTLHSTLLACAADLPPAWLHGCTGNSDLKPSSVTCYLATNVVQAFKILCELPPGVDVMQLSGGPNDVANFAVRRVWPDGTHFDITTQAQATSRQDLQVIATYVRELKPHLTLLVTACTPEPSCQVLLEFSGYLAKRQQGSGRYYLVERMGASQLEIAQRAESSETGKCQWHKVCTATGQPYRTFVTNHALLLADLPAFSVASHSQQLWPADVARAVNDSVCRLQARELRRLPRATPGNSRLMYPSVASGTGDDASAVPRSEAEPWRKCPGCRGRQARWDPRHTRIRGQCRFPDDEPHEFKCPACQAHRPLTHPTHTRGPDCRIPHVEARVGARRSGRHPRDPARRATDSTAADLQAQLPDGSDLGALEEEEAAERAEPSSSSGIQREVAPEQPVEPAAGAPAEPASVGEDEIAEAARERAPRVEHHPVDAAVGTEHASDWSRFDIGRSLRVLRVGNDRAVTTELRKLHLRFWHASRQAMTQILKHAGVSNRVLEMVPQVIQACVECRKWQRPGPATQHAMTASIKFNQHVECDLLFYRSFTVFHSLCRATRWHSAVPVSSKEGEVLFEAFTTSWVNSFGPPETLYMDGESGMWRPDVASRIKRLGCNFKVRAPQQHARYIERRGAVLRATLHVMEEQLERESLVYQFPALLAEAVFSGNALTHVGGSTPYQAVYGRQPWMLPPIEAPDLTSQEATTDEGDRQRELIRQTALSAMISATAAARLSRAANSRTGHDSRDFKEDDLCDIFRKPVSKDASGWSGPHRVIRSEPGQVVVKIKGVERTYRSQDVRPALLCLLAEHQTGGWAECILILSEVFEKLKVGQSALYGFAANKHGERSLS